MDYEKGERQKEYYEPEEVMKRPHPLEPYLIIFASVGNFAIFERFLIFFIVFHNRYCNRHKSFILYIRT